MASASATFKLSSDGGTTYLDPGVAMADAEALDYASSGTYSIKAKLDSTAGVDSATWTITTADDLHVGSLPTVTPNNTEKSCTFSVPKTGGVWVLEVLVNNGRSQNQTDPTLRRKLAIKVRNSVGQQEIAVGETTEAGSLGYTKAWNDLARALATSSTPSSSRVLYCGDGSVAGADVYTDFALAVAAATALKGQVALQILGSAATIPAGTYDLANRIELVGVPPSGTSQVVVTLADTAILQKATQIAGVAATTQNTSGAAITVSANKALLLSNTALQTAGTGYALAPSNNTQVVLQNGSAILAGTQKAVQVAGTDATAFIVEGTSSIADDQIAAGGSTSVTLTKTSNAAVIGDQPSIAGTKSVSAVVNGAEDVSVTGQTTVAPSGLAKTVIFSGAMGGVPITVNLMNGGFNYEAGTAFTLINQTTGAGILSLSGGRGGQSIWIPPGSTVEVTSDGADWNVTSGNGQEAIVDVTVTGAATGTTTLEICTLPTSFLLTGAWIVERISPSGGPITTLSLGIDGGDQTELIQAKPPPATGDILGEVSSDLGALLSTTGRTYLSGGADIAMNVVAGGTVTGGVYRVKMVGIRI
jgi:hypothetical protein